MTAWLRTQHPRELTPSEAYELDYRVAELIQHINQRRLALGDALHWLHQHGGALKLGFPGTDLYGHEVIQERKRWCEDSRRLAKRLRELPNIRDALVSGILGWSMAELLARHATPETEEALVTTARMSSVREMRARLQPNEPRDRPAERVTVCATVKRTDAWYFEATRMLLAAITDSQSNDEHAEALLAEGMTWLTTHHRGIELPDTSELDDRLAVLRAQLRSPPPSARSARSEQEPAFRRGRREARAERKGGDRTIEMSDRDSEREADADRARPRRLADVRFNEAELPTDPYAAHELIVDGLLLYTSLDLDLALALSRLAAGNPWATLGFDSLAHYARERLGMSEQSARNRIQLAYAVSDMPTLGDALRDGRVGMEAARLIGRVASRGTVDAWIERASERTLKHLREEVEAAGLLERLTNDRTFELPPDDEALETVNDLERAVLAASSAHPN